MAVGITMKVSLFWFDVLNMFCTDFVFSGRALFSRKRGKRDLEGRKERGVRLFGLLSPTTT